MKCLIVVNAYIKNNSQINQAQRIAEELKLLKVECNIIKNVNLAKIKSGKIISQNTDFCVFLDKDKSAARLLEKSGVRLFNCADAIGICDDKMLTHIELANSGIPTPDCINAPLCYYSDAQISEQFIDAVEREFGYPLVAKQCFGSLGAGVFLIKNRQSLIDFENEHKLLAHFYQRFVGRGGEDTRVIVIGGKYICSMRRKNENDFRSNVELGGKGEKCSADEELIALCENTARKLKLDYCGIDILTDLNGNRFVCEVNSNAFFAEAERVCEINIAKKYADYIVSKI